ncbi:ABC transporter substrate-binding protein [Rhodovastum atsumiense]|uniref:ABC transporter substrate-binding protein n=1 Tax=Rhodovastum atsumiense TaxID=504468 RepID=A0A5M6J0L3_9PROT|nr:ABC transporter substrate-binding protein [Rhodovastum atsumiense]KAA5614134.1 ABC transporter substrate-binding protein [Rhodovastum atsumiense]CAH2598984.1 ABC transporter substrate-binding protein [Rhodovastum atsumiense]
MSHLLPRRPLLMAAMAGLAGVTGAHAAPARPRSIRVTYVTAPFNVPLIVMRANGYLQEAFAPLDIAVETPVITSGAAQFQAIAAGAIDIASVLGDTSAIIGRANGVDLKVIGAFSRSPRAFAIMTRADGPDSIEALRGRTVGGPKGTTLNQLLAAALAARRMRLADVNYLNMDLAAARAALLAGQIDAATLAGADAMAVTAAGGRIITTAEGVTSPMSVIAVRGAFLAEHPDLVRRYLGAHARALAFLRDQPARALDIAAAEQKLSPEDARTMWPWYDFSPAISAADLRNLEACQHFLVSAGMLQKTIDIEKDLLASVPA